MDHQSLRYAILDLGLDVESFDPLPTDPSVLLMVVRSGDVAMDTWSTLRSALDRTGHWPIICGRADEELEFLKQQLKSNQESAEQLLARVPALPPLDALREHEEHQRSLMAEWMREHGRDPSDFILRTLEFSAEEEDNDNKDGHDDDDGWPGEPPDDNDLLIVRSAWDLVGGARSAGA